MYRLWGRKMKQLDRGNDKVAKICDELRRETLEPAQAEAARIVQEAKDDASRIIADASKQAQALLTKSRQQSEQEQELLRSSLAQATKQAIEQLKQDIEVSLFNPALEKLVVAKTSDPKAVADLVNVIVKALEKEGLAVNLSALVATTVDPKEVNKLLVHEVLQRLSEKGVLIGEFAGGAQVKLKDKKMTLDITDVAIRELLSGFLREGFRKFIFAK